MGMRRMRRAFVALALTHVVLAGDGCDFPVGQDPCFMSVDEARNDGSLENLRFELKADALRAP